MKSLIRGPVSFQYPGDWELITEDDGGTWTVTLQSPGTAFMVVTLRPEMEDAGQLAEETLAAMSEEYKELDAEAVVVSLGGWPALGHDIDFLTVDTPTLCLSRSLNTTGGPVLFLAQVSEFDRATMEPILRAMLNSVVIQDEE